MKVVVSGSSGLVGSALCPALADSGHEVLRLVRGQASGNDISWDPAGGTIDSQRLEGVDAVIHLAGENIAEGRWTEAKKARIRDSRVQGTTLLSEALAGLDRKPSVLLSSSAVGFYGDRGEEVCDESTESGSGFLPEVCRQWEMATIAAKRADVRVANLRTGIVLSSQAGALAKMLLPFQLGLGGVVGSGRQYWSWIVLEDLVSVIVHGMQNDSLTGPVNATSPNPVTNREFTKTLGRVLSRPTVLPMPATAARLALGEMANELLLASARVVPRRLQESGFTFRFPELEPALRHVLRK